MSNARIESDLLFVYGTLRPGFGHPMGYLLARHSTDLGAATVSGKVYDLGRYPGLITPAPDAARVKGELFRLADPGYLLPLLDDYEGCGENAQPPTEFIRTLTTVTRADGGTVTAWVYPYNWGSPPGQAIAGGDYLAHLAQKEQIVAGNLMQVILYVQEMTQAVSFYRDVLGLTIVYPAGLESYADQSWVEFATGECALCLHAGGEGKQTGSAPSFTFRVADIEWSRRELAARGVEMGEIFDAAPGIRVCRGMDPDGHPFAIEMK